RSVLSALSLHDALPIGFAAAARAHRPPGGLIDAVGDEAYRGVRQGDVDATAVLAPGRDMGAGRAGREPGVVAQRRTGGRVRGIRSEEHTSELQSPDHLV